MLKNLTVILGVIVVIGALGVEPAEAAASKYNSCVCHTNPDTGQSKWELVTSETHPAAACSYHGSWDCGGNNASNVYDCNVGSERKKLGKGTARQHAVGHGERYFTSNITECSYGR